jgi:hypothetical protein
MVVGPSLVLNVTQRARSLSARMMIRRRILLRLCAIHSLAYRGALGLPE